MKTFLVTLIILTFFIIYQTSSTKIMKASQNIESGLIDFTNAQEVDNWRITNDGVMGGLSLGIIKFEQDHGLFSGNISLENNGGFSSTFRAIKPLSKSLSNITIDVMGDGLVYQLRMTTIVDGYRMPYKHNFTTRFGQRQKITFSLEDFQASFRGRRISNAPELKSADVIEVGFLINNKKAEGFSLSIFKLQFN